MKKLFFLLVIASTVLFSTSCNKENMGEMGGEGTETGGEGNGEAGEGGEGGSGNALGLNQPYDVTANGVRLILKYDATTNSFVGTVQNVSNAPVTNVRIEVHLSNGLELGPLVIGTLAPGEIAAVNLPVPNGASAFNTYLPHAEVGSGENGGEGSGEGGNEGSGEGGNEGGCGGGTGPAPVGLGNEVDFSSSILQKGQGWTGVMGGLVEVVVNYNTVTNTIYGTVKNISTQNLCWGLSEPHLKLGTQTVGELGPLMFGDLAPGQTANISVDIYKDPKYKNYAFDGYVQHIEVYDCNAGIPCPYPGGVAVGGGEGGNEGSGEGSGHEGGNGEGSGEGSGSGEAGEGGSGTALDLNQPYDVTANGVQLVMHYDSITNSFVGTVKNVSTVPVTNVRIEVHLSNGLELGPLVVGTLVPGQIININLPVPAGASIFNTYLPHAEVGAGENGGGEGSGNEGSEGGSGEGTEGSGGG